VFKYKVRMYICVYISNQLLRAGLRMCACHYVWDQDVKKKNRVCPCVMAPWILQKKKKKSLCLQFNAAQYSCTEVLSCFYFRRHLTSSPVLFTVQFFFFFIFFLFFSFFFSSSSSSPGIVRAVCLSWLSADFAEQNACR
jgi:hypothetical protein